VADSQRHAAAENIGNAGLPHVPLAEASCVLRTRLASAHALSSLHGSHGSLVQGGGGTSTLQCK